MTFDKYKPLVFKSGYQKKPYSADQRYASVRAAIDYDTDEVLYFQVCIGSCATEHNFLSFEEAMLYCDINNLYVDTKDWDNPKIGMDKFFANKKFVLDNGTIVDLNHHQ